MYKRIIKKAVKALLKRRNKVWAAKASEVDGQWVNPNVKRDCMMDTSNIVMGKIDKDV